MKEYLSEEETKRLFELAKECGFVKKNGALSKKKLAEHFNMTQTGFCVATSSKRLSCLYLKYLMLLNFAKKRFECPADVIASIEHLLHEEKA